MVEGGGVVCYIADNPEEPGVRCLKIELSLSAAMMNDWDAFEEVKVEVWVGL